MLKNLIGTMFCALLLNCNPESDVTTSGAEVPLMDVLTFEFSFGGGEEVVNDEFLLARPSGFVVNDAGDILIADESRIKMFDGNGKAKMIIGGPGQGPGEFGNLTWASLGIDESGYLTVFIRGTYHVFSPEYEFIEKRAFRNEQQYKNFIAKMQIPMPYIFISGEYFEPVARGEMVFSFYNEPRDKYDVLTYINPDTAFVLKRLLRTSYIPDGRLDTPTLGRLFTTMLPERRIAYTHAGHDYGSDENGSHYRIHIMSLDTFEETRIVHRYEQMLIPDSLIESYGGGSWITDEKRKERGEIIKNRLRKKKFYPPISRMTSDGNYIFAFTYTANENGERLTDIFDASTGKYICSAYFPEWASVTSLDFSASAQIKNGYLYRLIPGYATFAEFQKYKIDPAVYGK